MDRYSIFIGKIPPPPPPLSPKKKPKESKKPKTDLDREAILSNLMRTVEGRSRLAASMAQPLRRRMDYESIARRAFGVQPLPQGALPVYETNGESHYLNEDGQQVLSTTGHQIVVPLFEIASNPQISLTSIQQRRFDMINRVQEHVIQEMNGVEETGAFSILERATLNNAVNAELSAESLAEIFSSIERNDLRVANLFMSPRGFVDLRDRLGRRDFLDLQTRNELLNVGVMGSLFGAQINVSRAISDGTIYVTAEPQFVGVIPIQTDITVLNADNPENRSIGFSIFEQIGMACINPNAGAVLNSPIERFVEPIMEEPRIMIPRMDRYALLKAIWE